MMIQSNIFKIIWTIVGVSMVIGGVIKVIKIICENAINQFPLQMRTNIDP